MAEDCIALSLEEKGKHCEDKSNDKLQSVDETVKCHEEQLEIKDDECATDSKNELMNEIKPENEKLNNHEMEIELKNKELETARNKLRSLEGEVELSNYKLKLANEKIFGLEKSMEIKNSKDDLTKEITCLKKQLKLKTSELNSMVDENKCLEIELEVKNNTILTTTAKLNSVEEEKKEELESVKKNFAKQLDEKDRELRKIKDEIKFMKSCYHKAVLKKDRAVNTEFGSFSRTFVPRKNKYSQTRENRFTCHSCNTSLCFSTTETQTCKEEADQSAQTEDVEIPEASEETLPIVQRKTEWAFASNPDYVYIETLKIYYSSSTGFYYDPETGISTDSRTGIKYVFCPETQAYRLFIPKNISQQILMRHFEEQTNHKRKLPMPENPSKVLRSEDGDVHMEDLDANADNSKENDFLENGDEDSQNSQSVASYLAEQASLAKATLNEESLPPSIRCIILESETLQIGSLLLVTYTGVTIGRGINCTMCIPDSDVNKIHARIDFDASSNSYVIMDLGSDNGTFVNDYRLSEPKQQSEPYFLNHEDVVSIASCKLLMHIHLGKVTCNNCEPGQVHADLISKNKNSEIVILSREEKEKERKKELRKIKKRYGLNNAAFEDDRLADIENLGYTDLAKERQRIKGSDNPYEKTEVQSVDQSLTVKNKGFKLLQKMGWSEGEGLGKTSSGRVEPVPIPSSVPSVNLKKKPVMSKAAMRHFQREISLRSGKTEIFTQPPVTQPKTFKPVNFVVAEAPVQTDEQEFTDIPDSTLSPADHMKVEEKQPEVVCELVDTKPPIDFLSKLVGKEPDVNEVSEPTLPPTDFLSKLVAKQPEVNNTQPPTSPPKTVEKKSDTKDESSSTLPPTDFLSKLVERKPKKKRRCREMVDGYLDPANQS